MLFYFWGWLLMLLPLLLLFFVNRYFCMKRREREKEFKLHYLQLCEIKYRICIDTN